MGNAEGLVQIQVTDIRADRAGGTETELRVEIGPVHVDLAAVLMNQFADRGDAFLEDSVGRGIGDHERAEAGGMLLRLRGEIDRVDVAIAIAGDGDDFEARHHRARRIGAVGGHGDEADFSIQIAARFVVTADREESGVFALRSRVRLHADGVEAGDDGEPVLEGGDHLAIAFDLVGRGEGMRGRDLAPAQRHHLGGGVELHRARAEWDHAPVQRDVLALEAAEVSQQLGLGVETVEDGLSEELAGAAERIRQSGESRGLRPRHAEDLEEQGPVAAFDERLVEGNPEDSGPVGTEVDPDIRTTREDFGALRLINDQGEGVEPSAVREPVSGRFEGGGELRGRRVDATGDALEALRPMIDGIHPGHHREEDLGGADVRGRLLAADVLLAGLQGKAQGMAPVRIPRDPDETSRHAAFQGIAAGHVGGVRSAESHRHAEALRAAYDDVGAPASGRLEEDESQQIGRDDDNASGGLAGSGEVTRIVDPAAFTGILKEDADQLLARDGEVETADRIDDNLDPEGLGPGADDIDGLGKTGVTDQELFPFHPRPGGKGHGLGRGGGFVEERCVRHGKGGELADEGLVIQQSLEPSLRNLGLIGGVGRVPARILEDAALDHRWRDRAVVTASDAGTDVRVSPEDPVELREGFGLVEGRRQRERLVAEKIGGDDLADEGIERRTSQRREHRLHLPRRRAEVAVREGGGIRKGIHGRTPRF